MHTNDLIIEYSKNPTNKYIMEDPSVRYREHNRVCADVVEVFLLVENDTLKSFSFEGYMSIIATACTAITGEALEGESLDSILAYDESFVKSLIWEDISPRRRNASLIGLLAVKNAIHEYRKNGKREDFSDIMK